MKKDKLGILSFVFSIVPIVILFGVFIVGVLTKGTLPMFLVSLSLMFLFLSGITGIVLTVLLVKKRKVQRSNIFTILSIIFSSINLLILLFIYLIVNFD